MYSRKVGTVSKTFLHAVQQKNSASILLGDEKRIKLVGDRVDSGLNCNDIQRYRPWLSICTATDQIKSVSAIGRRQTVEETGAR